MDKSAACSTEQDTCEKLFVTNAVTMLVSMQQAHLLQSTPDFPEVVDKLAGSCIM
jgi:2,3-diketo-5-methylthio-1-phosphopentane phosphatase